MTDCKWWGSVPCDLLRNPKVAENILARLGSNAFRLNSLSSRLKLLENLRNTSPISLKTQFTVHRLQKLTICLPNVRVIVDIPRALQHLHEHKVKFATVIPNNAYLVQQGDSSLNLEKGRIRR